MSISPSGSSIESERMPKQDDVGDTPHKITSDGNLDTQTDDESINFDEFFDLAVLKNDLLSSQNSSSHMILGVSVLLTCLILSLFST